MKGDTVLNFGNEANVLICGGFILSSGSRNAVWIFGCVGAIAVAVF